ncbi:MAG: 2'-5' RNA ligase family protein [Actinomycetota bacterium]|nr:2'-5' RNA ligase family protein [Actinomycetota bacterium]
MPLLYYIFGESTTLLPKLDDASRVYFDRLRETYFLPERNYLRAHLTMFHKLPGEHEAEILGDIEEACVREPFSLSVTGPRFLGKGVACELTSPELAALRKGLAMSWKPWLGAQDSQRFKAHVTIQNKVAPKQARALYEELSAAFTSFEVRGVGLSLWRYVGGPWEPVATRFLKER